jgi:hypothetical protein
VLLSASSAVALLVSLGFALLFAVSGALYFVLRSRRQQRKKQWQKLSVLKRLVYRFRHLSTLGIPSILISFAQIYAELTKYDLYAARAWLQLTSGQTDGLGLACLLPLARSPFGRLLIRLFSPLLLASIVALGCLIAAIFYHFIKKRSSNGLTRSLSLKIHQKRVFGASQRQEHAEKQSSHSSSTDGSELASAYSTEIEAHDESEEVLMLEEETDPLMVQPRFTPPRQDALSGRTSGVKNGAVDEGRIFVEDGYSAWALLSSVTIMLLRFFYFSVAIASTEYFFSTPQACTGARYIQSHPWMLYAQASRFRAISIPFLVVFVVGLPVCFAVVLAMFWKRLSHPVIVQYIGGLITRYKPQWAWWELVLVARKLAIALVSRGIDEQDALFSGSLFLILTAHLLLQVTFRPWKRKSENILESIGATLLVLSLASVQGGIDGRVHASQWQLTILVFVALYALCALGLVAYQTFTEKTDYQMLWEQDHPISLERKSTNRFFK